MAMAPSILRWAFRSPLRLAVLSLAVAGILVGGVVLATSQLQHDPRGVATPLAQPSHRPAVTVPRPRKPIPSETVDARERRGAVKASRDFVNAWARSGRPVARGQWLRSIRLLTTDSLSRGLKITALAQLPRGRVDRVHMQEVGAFAATSTVTLTSGLQVEVQLVAEKGRWVVADLRPVGP